MSELSQTLSQLDLMHCALDGIQAALGAAADGQGFDARQCDSLATLMDYLLHDMRRLEAKLRGLLSESALLAA